MPQHDYVIANGNGSTVRADINAVLLAIAQGNSGATAPTTTYAHMYWVDTTTTPPLLMQRDASDAAWIYKGYVSALDLPSQGLVHETGTPAMTVTMNPFRLIQADGTIVSQNAQTSGTITAPAANPRIDVIVVDANTGAIGVITGSEAASPSIPALTAGKIPMAYVTLATATTEITDDLITDYRIWMSQAHGMGEALMADGSVAATAALPMGGQKITGGSAGTAATDFVILSQVAELDPFTTISIVDDFIVAFEDTTDGILQSQLQWQAQGNVAVSQGPNEDTNPGTVALSTSTSSTGGGSISTGHTPIVVGAGAVSIGAVINLADLASVGEDYDFAFGIASSLVSAGTPSDGIYFRYERGTDTEWLYACRASSTGSETASGVTVAADWVKLEIEINADATSVVFKIDGSTVGTVTTNIPSANLQPEFAIKKSAGTTARVAYVDLFRYRQVLTTGR